MLLPVVVLLGLFAFATPGAQAALTHQFVGEFGPDGTEGTTFAPRMGGIAVDQATGDVYAEDSSGTVYKFGPEGEEREFSALGSNELSGFSFNFNESDLNELAVNSTTHDLYVVESPGANQIAVFHANGEPGEFSALGSNKIGGFGELCGVAVDANGDIYAGDFTGGISVFAPSGELLTTFSLPTACGLAVDSSGVVYVNLWVGNVVKLSPDIYPVTSSTTYTEEGVIEPGENFGVAVDPSSDELYVDKGNEIVQHDSTGKAIGHFANSGKGAISGSEGVAVLGPEGQVFAADQSSRHVKRYGPNEIQPPIVGKQWAAPVNATEATVHAEVNPEGLHARYSFEYGTEDCGVSLCQSTEELPLGAGESMVSVTSSLSGLQPNTTYHFRVKVTSEVAPVFGADRTFRTPSPANGGASLLDDRGYELVSPAADSGAEFGVPFPAGGLINSSVKPQRAADDGQSVAYASFSAVGEVRGAPPASFYLSSRGTSGWSTENITPPDNTGSLAGPVRGFTSDLSHAGVVSIGQPLTPDALPEFENLYLRNDETGTLTALTTETPEFTSPGRFCVDYMGASEGAQHVIFIATGGLTPEAPASPEEAPNLYDWSAATGLHLVNIFEDGTPAVPKSFGGFGAGLTECGNGGGPIMRNAISSDGSHIFWTYRPGGIERELFVRIDDARTIQLDAAAGGPDPGGGGEFLAASADGNRAFFTDQNRLVPEAAPNDLYEYNVAAEELRDLTLAGEPANVQGLVAAAEDGSYVYFVATGALAGGAEAGKDNLYLWHEGTTSLVGVLSTADASDWQRSFKEQTARATPDGKHLAFQSTEPLTGFDNEIAGSPTCELDFEGNPSGSPACPEVFLYNAVAEELQCASCNPSGSNPSAPPPPNRAAMNGLPKWSTPTEQPRYLSDDGSRLFFESYESLVPGDTNQRKDIYEFEQAGAGSCTEAASSFSPSQGGCVQLITTGTSGDETYFIDASDNGDDVFFSTRQRLVPDDQDNRFDVYDARVGGGLPAQPAPSPPCSGEGCRPASSNEGEESTPGSMLFTGPGNAKPRKACQKGKVRKHGHCVSRRHRKRKHHRVQGSAHRGKRQRLDGRGLR